MDVQKFINQLDAELNEDGAKAANKPYWEFHIDDLGGVNGKRFWWRWGKGYVEEGGFRIDRRTYSDPQGLRYFWERKFPEIMELLRA